MILLVAGPSCMKPENSGHIAATKKISTLIYSLGKKNKTVKILNMFTGNFACQPICNEIRIKPFLNNYSMNWKINYVLNLIFMRSFKKVFAQLSKEIDISAVEKIWIYNFDALSLKIAREISELNKNIEFIFEVEDSIFSRFKTSIMKSFLDFLYFQRVKKKVKKVFSVNEESIKSIVNDDTQVVILPGIINKALICNNYKNKKIIGYAGGLSIEKGSDIVYDLILESDENFDFVVIGDGPDAQRFLELELTKKNFKFFHKLNEERFVEEYRKIDIFLNPHFENKNIYPFKLYEAISSGKIVITSKFDNSFFELDDALIEVKRDVKAYKAAIKHCFSDFTKLKKVSHLRAVRHFKENNLGKVIELFD